MDMKEMFKAMQVRATCLYFIGALVFINLYDPAQEEGFFCSLPQDPERTDMYCKPFPRN